MMTHRDLLFPVLTLIILSGCGGGGGVRAESETEGTGGGRNLISALTFDAPETFANGRVHETTQSGVEIQGDLSSELTPLLDCSGGQTTQAQNTGARIRWENLATGESGSTSGYAGCYNTGTIFGTGVRSYWSIGYVTLALGMNEIRFLTYDGSELVGEDVIRIRRLDGVPPGVIYRYPGDGAEGVPVNRPVIVVFSEPMLAESLDPLGLSLTEVGGAGVAAVLEYDAGFNVWRITPESDLPSDMPYEVRLSGRVQDQGGGGELGDDLIWRFRTASNRDDAGPAVANRWPDANGCDCAEPSTPIQVGFGEPLDSRTIGAETLVLTSEASGRVPVELSFRGDHLELMPTTPLAPDTVHRVTVAAGLADSAAHVLNEESSWTFRTGGSVPVGEWESLDLPPFELRDASGVWMDDAWFLWGAADSREAPCTDPDLCSTGDIGRGLIYHPTTGSWAVAAFEMDQYDFDSRGYTPQPFPEARRAPSVAWTGSEAVLFGGSGSDDGGAYDPVADSWRSIAGGWRNPETGSVPAFRDLAGQSTTWTGTEMLIWGGAYGYDAEPINRGWRYHPTLDRWLILGSGDDVDEEWNLLPDADPLAPEARKHHAAVWSGTDMIIWGGDGADGAILSSAGRYEPDSAAWLPVSALDTAPGSRGEVAAVWMGKRMIAWNGGSTARDPLAVRTVDLRIYDPDSDMWQASAAGWEPSFLAGHPRAETTMVSGGVGRLKAAWTGSALLVVGVKAISTHYDAELLGWVDEVTLATHLYDPAADRWFPGGEVEVSTGMHTRSSFTVVWTGDVLLVFVGNELLRFVPSGP